MVAGVPEISESTGMGLGRTSLEGGERGSRMQGPSISEETQKSSSGSSGCQLRQTQKEGSAFQLRVKGTPESLRFSRIVNFRRL